MAESDYNVADRVVLDADGNPVADGHLTAGDKVATTVQATPDSDAADFAATNNVAKPEYANYAAALTALAERDDIEGLAERRAREAGTTFGAADFMRAEVYDPATGAVNPAPRAGSVEGDAPDSTA